MVFLTTCEVKTVERFMSSIRGIVAMVSMLALAGCGGGGSSNPGAPAPVTPVVTPPVTATVAGVASKGIIVGGTVKIYALNSDGGKGAQLGQDTTRADGSYSIAVTGYVGPVTVEVSGNYTDEATGQTKSVPESAPLRAALGNASGNVTVAVTPLTDLAVRQAGALTAQNITTANGRISEFFKVDIIATTPVPPTSLAFLSTQTTQAQKDYTIALAAVSQIMQTSGNDLATVLASLETGISPTGLSAQAAATITTAASAFIANTNNQTGVSALSDTSLQTVGSTSMKLSLSLAGTGVAVRGFQTTLTLPAGVVIRAGANGVPLSGVIGVVGSAVNGLFAGKYTAASSGAPATLSLGLISNSVLALGDLVTIDVDLVGGISPPAAAAFSIAGSKVVDADGSALAGAALVLR
jgi:hypothetical protein